MLIRFPILLAWNIIRNTLRFPFVLLKAMLRVFVRPKPHYVRVNIHKEIPRWERKSSVMDWFQEQPEDLTLDDWRQLLPKLAQKRSVEGLVLEIHQLHTSWPIIDEFRGLLKEFRAQDKQVVLFFHQFGMPQFYLGTVADKILISPATSVMAYAPAFQSFFFGDLFKELGVSVDLQRMGVHKNAPENLTRSFPSPTYRGDLYELLYGLTQHLYADMTEHRQDDIERLRQVFAWGVFSPEEALQFRLIDGIRFSERIAAYLLEKNPLPFPYPEYPQAPPTPPETTATTVATTEVVTESTETTATESAETTATTATATEVVIESAETTATKSTETTITTATTEEAIDHTATTATATEVATATTATEVATTTTATELATATDDDEEETEADEYMISLEDEDVEGVVWWRWTPIRRKPLIAVIPVEGAIVDEKSRSSQGQQAVRSWVVSAIEEAQRNPRIKGVVLWVNSPGGSGMASEAIWWALQRLQEKKPVVTYMESYAASGGYYVAVGTQKIFSSPLCLTGSIGVFGGKVNVETLMQRLHVGYHVVGESPGIRMLSPFRSSSSAEQQRWREQLALFYDRFLMRVADNRKMTTEQVHELAQGKVYLGYQAAKLGLVDQCGNLRDAVRDVCEKAKISEPDVLTWFRPSTRFNLADLRASLRDGLWSIWPNISTPRTLSIPMANNPSLPSSPILFAATQAAGILNHINLSGLEASIVDDSFAVIDMMAKGDVLAWCDLQWIS